MILGSDILRGNCISFMLTIMDGQFIIFDNFDNFARLDLSSLLWIPSGVSVGVSLYNMQL